VLQDGTKLLARSVTYTYATFGISGRGGASAAINAKPDDRETALAAWIEEVRPLAEGNHLTLEPGNGITADDLAPLGWAPPDAGLRARGALAAAAAARGRAGGGGGAAPSSMAGRRVAVVGVGPVADAATTAAKEAGAELADDRYDAECDVLLVAGKAGCLDHETAATVQTRAVVPLSPVPVTARALAILGRADTVVVPDFISTAAPLLADLDTNGAGDSSEDPVEQIAAKVRGLASEGTGLWLAACVAAEEFLATWTSERPFGRPLA
jgi:hypothetical protein